MQLHPRTMHVEKARLELNQWTLDWAHKHELTYGEIISAMADRLGTIAKFMKRHERHGEDSGKRADEA